MLYAQDASVYQEQPTGVVFPRSTEDVQAIVEFAALTNTPLIPRAAGTSLAGQCVGEGLVVDLGRHMNQILEVNVEERWVRVQPGVILDDLNRHLAQYDLFFGPDTSTSNRCMIGGMIGNNSCGSHSIYFGQTRDHLLELGVVLADGSFEMLAPWDEAAWKEQLARQDQFGEALRTLDAVLRDNGELIDERYPRPEVIRRNTGFPLDIALNTSAYGRGETPFSLPKFLCGTEGTLAFTTEAKLNLVDKPKRNLLVCVHFDSVRGALEATIEAVEHGPAAVELMDRPILELTKHNIEQKRNRFFVEGEPEAILAVEFYAQTDEELQKMADKLIEDFRSKGLGYSFPIIWPPDDKRVWALRKAGLGLLMGMKGDTKPVTVVEDTAVAVDVLPDYIDEFAEIMDSYGTRCVYYAHASVGELHLRPELNLKDREDAERFKGIARDVADLVSKYGGALSGEHGDGRLRAPLLERFYGEEIMALHGEVKQAFDPKNIFNPKKIVDPEPIDKDWRFVPGNPTPEVDTVFDWTGELGLVRAVENCNGAGVCRKRAEAGGTMCPSYMATLDEKDTTRGRANVFRQALYSPNPQDAFSSEELRNALDLCLSCKGCKSECPANVDMARLKAEFTQQYHDAKGTPLSAIVFGHYGRLSRLASVMPWLANFFLSFFLSRWLMRSLLKVSLNRQLPKYASKRFTKQFARYRKEHPADADAKAVWLYVDPFTEYTEPELAMAAVRVLERGGWRVERLPVDDDGRTYLSKGLVRHAKKLTQENMERLEPLFEEHPDRKIVGLEPSALLTFRDESPDLCDNAHKPTAKKLADRALLIEEFVAQAAADGEFSAEWTDGTLPKVLLHGHCHQKALVGVSPTVEALEAAGYEVEALPTGCCGMAGSFGYEEQHYEVSMDIGELVLFPALRDADEETLVCAPGTSCRHQIHDGVRRTAHHPAILLERALR
ncbi:FAD-binding protein [Persicimonas caeni]|uniref:FAD-binding protein n=2 Tax=Persicimonas caeni TaxID=2292766 RepID=A0A4Y6Q2N1_PERCE|nr:FAD-binding protein [Persicimonas caeni]QED36056.1 FAD-binding protein [Persicimonas caeni]